MTKPSVCIVGPGIVGQATGKVFVEKGVRVGFLGIVKEQIPRIFAKLLCGSKFHRLKQSRGQQGIGISAAVMYAQLTTGKPTKIAARTHPKKPAHYYELHLDTKKNEPEVLIDREIPWEKDHGVKIELELEAKYQKGQQSIDEYLKQTAIVNPHLHLTYKNPEGELIDFPRGINKPPQQPKEIKPHPYGVELGILISMLKATKSRNLSSFLQTEFSRISPKIAKELCEKALLDPSSRPERIAREEADALYKAISNTKIMAPPTDCLSPIGEDAIEKGLKNACKYIVDLTNSCPADSELVICADYKSIECNKIESCWEFYFTEIMNRS